MRRLMPDAITIFIVAESEAQLVQRLVARKTEPLERLLVRVGTARAEVARAPEFGFVVVNHEGKLDECVAQIGEIIDVEKMRTDGSSVNGGGIARSGGSAVQAPAPT